MATWIVRAILAVLVIEAGICAAFLAEDWEALRHREESLFAAALSLVRPNERFVLDPVSPGERERHVRPLKAGTLQTYFHVPITEDSLREIGESALNPQNWHIFLTHMREVGCEVVAIEPPLTWEGDDFKHLLDLGSLDSALSRYETAVLTIDLQRVKTPRPIPDYLRQSAIPLDNVRGEVGGLVRVNRVIHPPSASPAPNIQFSFRLQESVEDVTPAFVRWDDYLIPSFPLAVAMAQNGIKPADVSIELGKHIRLGDGPLAAINEIGELQIDLVKKPRPPPQVPLELISVPSGIEIARHKAGEEIPRCVIFPDATADRTAPWPTPHRLQRIVNSFDVLPRPAGIERHQRLPLWAELLLFAVIAAVAGLLVSFRGVFRILGFGVYLIVLATLLATLFVESQRWTPLAPVVVAAATGFVLSFRMARYLPGPPASPQLATPETRNLPIDL